MRTILFSAMLGMIVMLTGCASIISGKTQEVSFQSVPEDVTVTVGEHEYARILGKTPFTIQLDRESHRWVTFSKPGYQPLNMRLTVGTNGWFWGNILFGGLLGSTTDSISGAAHEYDPSHYMVTLVPLRFSSVESATRYSQRDQVRSFIVLRYASLLGDLSTGRGENLASLMSMLHIENGREDEARNALLLMAQSEPDRAEFAMAVTERYMK